MRAAKMAGEMAGEMAVEMAVEVAGELGAGDCELEAGRGRPGAGDVEPGTMSQRL